MNDEQELWKPLNNKTGMHYNLVKLYNGQDFGMKALRQLFPDGEADYLNFVLFSTSGVHGTYNKIEEAEKYINKDMTDSDDFIQSVTFLIVHPRLVALRYGECTPQNQDDIDFLKKLRESSRAAVLEIG